MQFPSFSKLICITAFLSVTTFTVTAQKLKLYVKVSSSYQLGLVSNPVSSNSGNIQGQSFTIKKERVGINYGKGLLYNGAIGCMFNNNIGAELGLGYLQGKKIQAESRYYYPEYYITETQRFETYSRMILLQPAVVITSGSGKIKPFARMGAILAFGTIYENQYAALYNLSRELKGEYTGGYGFGFLSAAGLTVQANDNLDLFMEFTMNNLSYAPKKWTVTEAKENGNDALYKYEEEITFSDEHYQGYKANGEPHKITSGHRIHLPMSTMGFGLGLKFRL